MQFCTGHLYTSENPDVKEQCPGNSVWRLPQWCCQQSWDTSFQLQGITTRPPGSYSGRFFAFYIILAKKSYASNDCQLWKTTICDKRRYIFFVNIFENVELIQAGQLNVRRCRLGNVVLLERGKMVDVQPPPLRSLDDFLWNSARFSAPDIRNLEKWNNRIINNLLYYQTNYFASFLGLLLLVG